MNTSAILLISALGAGIAFSQFAHSGAGHDHHDEHEHEHEHDEEAHGSHDHSAHHHGTGHLNVAVEGNGDGKEKGAVVSIYLQAPGADILGFERIPDGSEEKETLLKAQATLNNSDALFTFEGVECAASPESGMEVSESGDYTDVVAEYTFDCASTPTRIYVNIQKYFADIQVLKVVWISDDGQGVTEVTSAKPQIELR
jgi:hypothetical protein